MVDVKRYSDAVGASAIAARTPWSGSAPNLGCTLAGAAGEGGLLATFDAIFQQTMTPQPTAPAAHDTPPSKSDAPPPADDAEPARAAEQEDEQEDDEAPPDVRLATPLAEAAPVETPELVVQEDLAVSEEEQEIESPEAAAAAAAAQKVETPTEQSAATGAVQVAEEQGMSPATEGKSQSSGEHGEHSATPVPQPGESDQPTQAVEQIADPTVPSEKPTAVKADTPVAERSDAADETPQVAKELHRGTVAMQEPQPTNDEPLAVDDAAPEEQTAEPVPDGDGESHRDRDRGRGARYSNHDEPGERSAGGSGARARDASGGNRTLDSLVAQMQAVEAGEAGAPPPPAAASGATPGAAAATASTAALAANPALAASASAASSNPTVTDASAPSDARFSIDGAGDRRSVGGIRSEAAGSGEGQVQRGSNADQVRLVQRVARSFQRLGPTGGRVQVMLHPAELGSVRLDLRIEGNRMNARMTAETDAARSILSEHLPELRQRLADSGLLIDRIEVEIDGRQQQEETGQGREGMTERRGGFHSSPQRPRLPRSGTSPSESAGGSGAIPQSAGAAYSRSALDLMA